MHTRTEKSRYELKDDIDKRKSGLVEDHMKKLVEDKKKIAEAARKLRYPLKDTCGY